MSTLYRVADCVTFCKTREAFGGLSNMAAGFPITLNGVAIRTSEALYQAMRFPQRAEVQAEIIRQASPMAAKMASKPHRADTRPDWDEVRIEIMAWALRVKLAQNFEPFADLLLSTGSLPIVEISTKDDFWGAKSAGADLLRGENVLGQLLTALRDTLLLAPESLARTAPPVPGMLLFGQKLPEVLIAA